MRRIFGISFWSFVPLEMNGRTDGRTDGRELVIYRLGIIVKTTFTIYLATSWFLSSSPRDFVDSDYLRFFYHPFFSVLCFLVFWTLSKKKKRGCTRVTVLLRGGLVLDIGSLIGKDTTGYPRWKNALYEPDEFLTGQKTSKAGKKWKKYNRTNPDDFFSLFLSFLEDVFFLILISIKHLLFAWENLNFDCWWENLE